MASETASTLAKGISGRTIELTPAGRLASGLLRAIQDSPAGRAMWNALSKFFASGAKGTVHAVIKLPGYVWTEIEEPILNSNGNTIIFHP